MKPETQISQLTEKYLKIRNKTIHHVIAQATIQTVITMITLLLLIVHIYVAAIIIVCMNVILFRKTPLANTLRRAAYMKNKYLNIVSTIPFIAEIFLSTYCAYCILRVMDSHTRCYGVNVIGLAIIVSGVMVALVMIQAHIRAFIDNKS
jgi:hypothetical protein